MLDFAYSVPPAWMASEPGVHWGLAEGFCEIEPTRRTSHGSRNRLDMLRASDVTGHADWAGLNDVAQSFARMWDEVDYGVMLLTLDAQLLYANHVARHELASNRGLRLLGFALAASLEAQQHTLVQSLLDAAQGKRSLQEFGPLDIGTADPLAVSFLPLEGSRMDLHDGSHHRVMAIMGKRRMCEELSFRMFARLHRLSPTETNVLLAIVEGHSAEEVAIAHRVAISTVRTQLNQVRAKTGARTLRDLVRRVAVLPPLVACVKPLQ